MNLIDYILTKSKRLSLPFEKEEVEVTLLFANLNPEDIISIVDVDLQDKLDTVFMGLVYQILITPDVSEGDVSIKFDRDSIRKWYSSECGRLEIVDPFRTDVVKDLSFLA